MSDERGRELHPKKGGPEKRIRAEGLVFHGLRKSAVCKLLEAGCTHKEVAAVTGHSLGQIEYYSRSADQLRLNEAAMRKMEA